MSNDKTRGNALLAVGTFDSVTPILRTLRDATRRTIAKPKKPRK